MPIHEYDANQGLELSHAPDRPTTVAELAEWLSNVAALDAAEVYRFIDGDFMREQYLEEAELAADTVLDDVKRGYYEVEESYRRYLLKQEGISSFAVVENAQGRRIIELADVALEHANA